VGEHFPFEFALHHLENGRVAVRFSLGHWVEVCRGMMIQVGVLVPVQPRWETALRDAERRRAGYLMKDVGAVAGQRRTVFNYRPRRP
jgi:type IV secretory pathway protease TraF